MNKIILRTVLLLAVTVLACACYKDKGNYDYHQIKEVQISGINSQYDILLGDPLSITPQFTFTGDYKGTDESGYRYAWIAIKITSEAYGTPGLIIKDTVATTRNLDNLTLSLAPSKYQMFYRVIDESNNVFFEKQFMINLSSTLYEGFLLLDDVNGQTRLDMLSWRAGSFHQMNDVLTTVQSGLPQGKPISINCYADARSPSSYAIYILNSGGTNRIDPSTFKYNFRYNIKYQMTGSFPDDFKADAMSCASSGAWIWKEDTRNLYYYCSRDPMYSVPVNTMSTSTTNTYFHASKYVVSRGPADAGGAMVFDDDSKSFVKHSTGVSNSCVAMSAGTTGGFAFDNNTGMNLLYMSDWALKSTSPNGANTLGVYAIMDNTATHICSLYAFTIAATDKEVVVLDGATDLYKADFFAVSPEYRYLYYNIGSKVYRYNFGSGNKELDVVYDAGTNKISMLKFHRFLNREVSATAPSTYYVNLFNKLIVCTYNPSADPMSCGKMELYTVNQGGTLSLYNNSSWSGLGKVVSVSYREQR